jgi:hypothetical protein
VSLFKNELAGMQNHWVTGVDDLSTYGRAPVFSLAAVLPFAVLAGFSVG